MKKYLTIVILIVVHFTKKSKEFSYNVESEYLFQFNNGCKNIDIRFDYRYFDRLKNCKSIHGYLRISDMDVPTEIPIYFEDIFEITGYILIDNVSGLRSLGQLFPNLTVLRGEILHHGFSMLITNNDDLENIGTGFMTHIGKGNVLIENNRKLCYLESVDWYRLRKGISVINKSNNANCSDSCSKCWAEEMPQKICVNCDSCMMTDNSECCDKQCIGGCKTNSRDCIACKNFKYNKGNITKCSIFEPLTFQLENHFLIDGLTCDRMGRIRLDDECLRKEECPLHENHYIINNQCTYCENCSFTSCSVVINNIEDVKKIPECNVAKVFKIKNLEDDMNEDMENLLREKFQHIVEIQSCLIISNSSGITNLTFLSALRKITGIYEDTECYIDGVIYSVIINNNNNLQDGFSNNDNIEIFSLNGIYIDNNRNLCQNEVKIFKNILKYSPKRFVKRLQTKECNHPKINAYTLPTNDSVLILTDLIRSINESTRLVYWKDKKEEAFLFNNSYYEISQLEPNRIYRLKIEIVSTYGEILYSTGFHIFKTLISNEIITNLKASSTFESINISWESIKLNHYVNRNKTNYSIEHKVNNIFYITFQKMNKDFCNDTILQFDKIQTNITQKFSKYFLKDPSSEIKNSKSANHIIINDTHNHVNITNLLNSTCYRFDIYPCLQTNILMCSTKSTLLWSTLTPLTQNVLWTIFGVGSLVTVLFLIIIVIISIYYRYFRAKNSDNFETYLELQNQGGLIQVDQWELQRENIVQIKILGSGEFGIVYKGYIKPNEEKLYAIKTLAPFKEAFEESFIKEAQIMRKFNAFHVVKLIGYCTKERPLLVVMEYMMHGDLKKFLQRNRPIEKQEDGNTNSQKGNYTTAPITKTTLHPLLRPVYQMAIEIADGMMYLESIKFIHCDLACRNLMVHETYTIKIGDFGMARELYHTDYYKPGSRNKKIPLRWMSPEALGTEKILPRYTSKSDVFSFGIVLFELTTFCDTPYAGCLDEEVIEIIKMGRILDKPKDCDDKIYELMKYCWRYNPDERISFKEVIEYLLENFHIPNFKNNSFYHSSLNLS